MNKHIHYILIVFIIIIATIAECSSHSPNPLKNPKICGRPECELENNKFLYKPTIHYKYNYQSHIRTEFSGTGSNVSEIFVTGTAILTFPTKCEGVLKLGKIKLYENAVDGFDDLNRMGTHKKSEDFSAAVERNELRFAFHDGLINELCPASDEQTWIVNLKRGILSSFQNTMQRFDIDHTATETDISGTCDVTYTLNAASGTTLLIQKSKDITTCLNRYKTNSIVQTDTYDFRKQFSVWPLLDSASYCNISVDHNIYQEVKCYEKHQLIPFSNNGTGAITTSNIELKLVDEESFTTTADPDNIDDITTRAPLLFSHAPSPKPTSFEIKHSREFLKQMCSSGFPNIKRDFINSFSKFLSAAKSLSPSALHQLLARSKAMCSNGESHVLESLPFIGTTASVKIMVEKITKNEVSPEIIKNWLTSLSFIPRPTEEMLDIFYRLVDYAKNGNTDPKFVLSATSVVHTFCRSHSDCAENDKVLHIVNLLEEKVIQLFRTDLKQRSNREEIIVFLKGLGNIGIFSQSFQNELRIAIQSDRIENEIKLQSIYAHRRHDCTVNRNFFHGLYSNLTINSEIRIASYLQAIRCPDYKSIGLIKNVLKQETVNQVGSYVWSHLSNLAKSSSPVRVEVQGLLVDNDLGTKFKMDLRKFSHYFEHSLFFDEYNVGGSTETNLIFGIDSYIPRSTSFNLTVDLFGESVNVVEMSAYFQGFEHMVESVFGPKGPLNAEGFLKKIDFLLSYFREKISVEDFDYFDNLKIRQKRAESSRKPVADDYVDSESMEDEPSPNQGRIYDQQLQKDVKNLDYKLKYDMDNPRAAFDFKVFGNDIAYKTVEGNSEIAALLYKTNPLNQIKSLLSGREIKYTQSGVFLDISYEVPLCSGFPLALHAYGASSVDLLMSGSLDGISYWNNPSFDVQGKLKPSVSLDIITSMQSDYYYGASGIRVKSNLFSSSRVESKLKVRGKKLVSFQFGLPQDRNDIFSASSEILVMQYAEDLPQYGIEKRYTNSSCTWPTVERAIGLKLCGTYALPDVSESAVPLPSLVLCGPINVDFHIFKTDLTAKTYSFEYRWTESKELSQGTFVFETPGSIIPRIFSANITKDPTTYKALMMFKVGSVLHSANGLYKNTDDVKLVEAYLNIDGKQTLALEMGMNRSEILNGWQYYPRFSLAINNDSTAGLQGTVRRTNKKGILQYDANLSFDMKRFKAELRGNLMRSEHFFTTKLKLDYQFKNNKTEVIEMQTDLSNQSDKSRNKYFGMLIWNSTAYPKYNFNTTVDFYALLSHLELKIKFNNAVDLLDKDYDLNIRLAFVHSMSKNENPKTQALVQISRPISKMDYNFTIMHELYYKRGRGHKYFVSLQYAKYREVKGLLKYTLPFGNDYEMNVLLNVSIPSFKPCVAQFSSVQIASDKYNLEFDGVWFSGHSVNARGNYIGKSTIDETSHNLKVDVKSPHFNETSINAHYNRNKSFLTVDLKLIHGDNPYEGSLKFGDPAPYQKQFAIEAKFHGKEYSLTSRLNKKDERQFEVDLHIDKIRDMRLILRDHATAAKKEVGIEIRWDVNRDPTQKLTISVEFENPERKRYKGGMVFSYPERTFSGSFELFIPGPNYTGIANIAWGPQDVLQLSFNAKAILGQVKNIWFDSQLRTPFDGWHRNELKYGFYHLNNLLLANASVLWANDQKVDLVLKNDYDFSDPHIRYELKLLLNSLVKEIPTINAIFNHRHSSNHLNTDVLLKHVAFNETPNLLSVMSKWNVSSNEEFRNLTGSVALESSIEGYQTGVFGTRFSLNAEKWLYGTADLHLENKKYTFRTEGKVKKILDSMLVVNITTPIEKYRDIFCRFGLNEQERHILAAVNTPLHSLGIEVKFDVTNQSNFDVKLHLQTLFERAKNILLIAKMKPDNVDFQGGWDEMQGGFVSIYRMISIKNFEYVWKFYTPLEKHRETSFVAKFIHRGTYELDLELMFKLSKNKLGIMMNAKPKPKMMQILRLQRLSNFKRDLNEDEDNDVYLQHFQKVKEMYKSGDESEEEEDSNTAADDNNNEYIDNVITFTGSLELNTIIWTPIQGVLDVDEINDNFIAFANITIPQGNIVIRNNLYFPDLSNVRNLAIVSTPLKVAKQIKLFHIHSVEPGKFHIFAEELSFLNQTDWIDVGYRFNYTRHKEYQTELKLVDLSFATPFDFAPKFHLNGNLETTVGPEESTSYQAGLRTDTAMSQLSLYGSADLSGNDLDVTARLTLNAPTVPEYTLNVMLKKEMSILVNSLKLSVEEVNDNEKIQFNGEANWYRDEANYFRGGGKIQTNVFPIQIAEVDLYWRKEINFEGGINLWYENLAHTRTDFSIKTKKDKQQIVVQLVTPLRDFTNVTIDVFLLPSNQPNRYSLTGKMFRPSDVYDIDGFLVFTENIPSAANLNLVAQRNRGAARGNLVYLLTNSEVGYGKNVDIKIVEGKTFFEAAGSLSAFSKLHWTLTSSIKTSPGLISNKPNGNQCKFSASVTPQNNENHFITVLNFTSPWRHLGIDAVNVKNDILITPKSGNAQLFYDLSLVQGHVFSSWSLDFTENLKLMLNNRMQKIEHEEKSLKLGVQYTNSGKKVKQLTFGGILAVNSKWRFEANASLEQDALKDIKTGLTLHLPGGSGSDADIHNFDVHYYGDIESLDSILKTKNFNYDAKYSSKMSQKKFSSQGRYRNETDLKTTLRADWGTADKKNMIESNVQILRKGSKRELLANVKTPFYNNEESLIATGSYDKRNLNHILLASVNVPASRSLLNTSISFSSLSNTNGFINSTTPFKNITWIRIDVDSKTTGANEIRYLKATWPKNYAYVGSNSTFTSTHNLGRDRQGTIKIDVPLTNRHLANIKYELSERADTTTGLCTVDYNTKTVLFGQYACKSEIRDGFSKDDIHITIENDFKPVGINYIHQMENGSDSDRYDMKRAELYILRNSGMYNITGELHVHKSLTGKKYKIIAIHPNRTVTLTSDFDNENAISKQHSKLELSPEIWIAYAIKTENLSSSSNDSQVFNLELMYPRRNLSASGWYSITPNVIDSDVSFTWTKDANTVQEETNDYEEEAYGNDYGDDTSAEKEKDAQQLGNVRFGLKLKSEPLTSGDRSNQSLLLTIKHPTFSKDITFDANLYRGYRDLLQGQLVMDYTTEPSHLLTFKGSLKDHSSSIVGHRNYSVDVYGLHDATSLDLFGVGSIASQPGIYQTDNYGRYKRSYLSVQEGILNGGLILPNKEIYFKKVTPNKRVGFWAQTDGKYPIYVFNASFEHSPDINTTAEFFIDLLDKTVRLDANFTPDATQNLRMHGSIPDAQYASFYIQRDYDDIRIVDISYYMRMNHSRLITSEFIWRPKIKSEIKNKFRQMSSDFYDSFSATIDFWVKTMYSESTDTVTDIWQNAKPFVSGFVNDVSGLQVLADDIDELRKFLNQSYEANDFYVKDVVSFTLTLLDELAIRNHIDSLPRIFNEFWQFLGDSGVALRKSILWLIETIKISYKNAVDILGRIFHGDALGYLSGMMEKAVYTYDKCIKDLHLTLVKHVQNIYDRIINSITNQWRLLLDRITPTVMNIIQSSESLVVDISQEIYDFLHKRSDEFVRSPYFDTVSIFTQDMDRLYQDLTTNDLITNIRKYSLLTWQFVKEKYFKFVPFGKELQNITNEVWDELRELEKQELVQFLVHRANEFQKKLEWLAEELQLDKRLHQLGLIIKRKITYYSETALEADDRYREAKTEFIFDPDKGQIKLAQKLPVAWHSFNETPILEEIAEYRFFKNSQELFSQNLSIANIFEEVRYYMDPHTWLPPFKSHAILIGSRHYITFDKRFISLNHRYGYITVGQKLDQCSYLLAHDFLDGNFTIVQEPSIVNHNNNLLSSRKLAVIADHNIIDIDMIDAVIRIDRDLTSKLPVQIGDTVIYRESEILIIRSKNGFQLSCNLQFDLCWLELSGWYFGKTAGILGTVNNEIYDDFLTSRNTVTEDQNLLKESWSLNKCKHDLDKRNDYDVSDTLLAICQSFFYSDHSQFANCFPYVDPVPFYDMCLDMGENSISNFTHRQHPAQKGACSVALAYIEICHTEKKPLRVPDICVHCDWFNGTYLPEGTILELRADEIPKTTDVVFIIEAKPCNKDILASNNLISIINEIHKKLNDSGIINNRYSIVAFGGAPPFDSPRSIVYRNEVFTDYRNIRNFFGHIKTSATNHSDVFEAIHMASNLIYRPGVTKTFILLPCSQCNSTLMKFDYSSVLQVLIENNINLHILMNDSIKIIDVKYNNTQVFGFDRDLVYTKEAVDGDKKLRTEIRLPKQSLGLCTALAIESSGTIFTKAKLRPDKRNVRLASIFAKRIAKTAVPAKCQECECTGHNSGVAYMSCTSCDFRNPSSDYDSMESIEEEEEVEISEQDIDWSLDDSDSN